MAKITENTIYNWLQLLPKMRQYLSSARQKVRSGLKTTGYWSGIGVIGFAITTGIMYAAGLPLFNSAEAALSAGQQVAIFLGNILYYGWIGPVSGILLVALAYILQIIINYPHGDFWSTVDTSNDIAVGFVRVEAVVTGWKLVRDISNVFFSVILVIIALGSVLKIESYSWKQLLPKFVVMAILINFSKTICGVFTDVATVAMATFAGSFGNSFAIGLVGAFNLASIADFEPSSTGDASVYEGTSAVSLFGAYLAAAIMTLVFGMIMVVLVAVFFLRIVMLWFLIVLSPLAYIARILPMTKSYSSEWWSMFGKWVMVGPMMTFFLWLTLTMAYGVDGGNPITEGGFSAEAADRVESRLRFKQPETGFQATSTSQLATFLVATVMLMGSMSLVKRMADGAGSIVGKAEGLGYSAFGGAIKGANLRRMTSGIGASVGSASARYGAVGEDGKTRWGGKFVGAGGKFVNGGMQLLAGTIFNPVDALKNLGENIGARRAASDKLMDRRFSEVTSYLNGQASKAVGTGNVPGALATSLQLLASAVGSVGKDGQAYLENTLSAKGMWRMVQQVAKGGKVSELKAKEKEQADALDAIKAKDESETQIGSQQKYDELAKRRAELDADLTRATDNADGLLNNQSDNVTINTNDDSIASEGVTTLIADLEKQQEKARKSGNKQEADDIEAQIDALKGHLDANPASSLKAIQDAMAAAQGGNNAAVNSAMTKMMQRMQKAYQAKSVDAKDIKERENLGERLKNVDRNSLADPKTMKEMEKELNETRTEISKNDLFGMPANMQFRAMFGGAIKEAQESIAGMSQQDLRKQLALAERTQDRPMAIAALQELSSKPWGLAYAMKSMGGSYDYDGATKMTEKLAEMLGGNTQAASGMMAEWIGNAGASHLNGMFFDTENGWVRNSQKQTEAIAAGNMMQDGVPALNRKFGTRSLVEIKQNGERTLSQAAIKAIKAGSQSWGSDLEFRRLPDSLKEDLRDHITALEQAGANPEFIRKLRAYQSPLS